MSTNISWVKLRTMPVEDWPQISGESMLNIMVEQDRHYWPSGCSTQVHNLQEVFDKVKEQIKKRK